MNSESWRASRPDIVHRHIVPEPFLGEWDADVEWAAATKPTEIFLHTNSYNQFKRPDTLFLFGRRGTGKTTVIRMLQHEVREQKLTTYKLAAVVSSYDAYKGLAIQMRASQLHHFPADELVHVLQKNGAGY